MVVPSRPLPFTFSFFYASQLVLPDPLQVTQPTQLEQATTVTTQRGSSHTLILLLCFSFPSCAYTLLINIHSPLPAPPTRLPLRYKT
jgi:hypothetical protein